jgi:transcriptional regulator with XRE-family HTH domain
MKLSDWLKENRWQGKQFAEMIGVSEALVSLLRRGHRTPTKEVLLRITKATNGKVKANDFVYDKPST